MLNYFIEILKLVYTGLELASSNKKYRKLVVEPDYGMSYGAGVFYCSSELITYTSMLISNIKKWHLLGYSFICFIFCKELLN